MNHRGPARNTTTRRATVLLALAALCTPAMGQTTWVLGPDNPAPGMRFGAAIQASSTSGTPYLAVGAPGGTIEQPGPSPGQAYIFQGPDWHSTGQLFSPDPQPGDLFGFSVHIDTWEFCCTLVGAPGANRAYQFLGSSSGRQAIRLDASAGVGPNAQFGYAVTALGAALTVSAPAAAGGGAVFTFQEFGAGGPESVAWQQRLNPVAGDTRFGASLTKGETLQDQAQDRSGYAIGVGAPGDGQNPGAAYVYTREWSGVTLTQRVRLTGPPLFGTEVRLSDRILGVLEPRPDSALTVLHIYGQEDHGVWTEIETTRVSGVPAPHADALWVFGRFGSLQDYTWEAVVMTAGHAPGSFRRTHDTALAPHMLSLPDSLQLEHVALPASHASEFWAMGSPDGSPAGAVFVDTTSVLAQQVTRVVDRARFMPAAVGDSWSYRHEKNYESATAAGDWIVQQVIADTLIEGASHLVLQTEDFDADGTRRTHSTCAVPTPLDSANRFAVLTCEGAYCLCRDQLAIRHVPSQGVDLEFDRLRQIGRVDYWFDAVATMSAFGHGPGGIGGGGTTDWASDVGTLRRTTWNQSRTTYTTTDALLEHATVGGLEWGTPIQFTETSSEPDPPQEGPVQTRVDLFPNPADGATTLEVESPDAGAVRVRVYDVLGRLVLTTGAEDQPPGLRVMSLPLDRLVPGLYVAQVELAGQWMASKRVLRR